MDNPTSPSFQTIASHDLVSEESFVQSIQGLPSNTRNKAPSPSCHVMMVDVARTSENNRRYGINDSLKSVYDKEEYSTISDKPIWESFRDNTLPSLAVTTDKEGRKVLNKKGMIYPCSAILHQLSMTYFRGVEKTIQLQKSKPTKQDLIHGLSKQFKTLGVIANESRVLALLVKTNTQDRAVVPAQTAAFSDHDHHRRSLSEPATLPALGVSATPGTQSIKTIQQVETHDAFKATTLLFLTGYKRQWILQNMFFLMR